MIVTVAPNVTVEVFQSVRYKRGLGYTNTIPDYGPVYAVYWYEPIMKGWRWSINIRPREFNDETLVMGVLCDTLEQSVIAAYRVIETDYFQKMLTAWPVGSLQ